MLTYSWQIHVTVGGKKKAVIIHECDHEPFGSSVSAGLLSEQLKTIFQNKQVNIFDRILM